MQGSTLMDSWVTNRTLDLLEDIKDLLKDQAHDIAQLQNTQIEIIDLLKKSPSETGSSPAMKLLHFLKPIVSSPAGQWSLGILTASYVWNGGDLLTILSSLSKLFGGAGLLTP
jgi:hypothetical protein